MSRPNGTKSSPSLENGCWLSSENNTGEAYYNLDIDPEQYWAVEYYFKADEDLEQEQKLQVLFCDIEVYNHHRLEFPDPEKTPGMVTAISTYSERRGYRSYFLGSLVAESVKEDIAATAGIRGEELEIRVFDDEKTMLRLFWKEVREEDPAILSGWNSDLFDYPYLYNRLRLLVGDEADRLVSRFGRAWFERRRGSQKVLRIPEYCLVDLLYLYRPRVIEGNQEGGLNYGKVLPSYSLDYVAEHVLKEKKLAVPWSSLDALYDQNPVHYLAYNLRDVVLVKLLNEKLQHLKLHNLIRRLAYAGMNLSLKGTTALLDTYLLHRLRKSNLGVRSGLAYENQFTVSEKDVEGIPRPKGLKAPIRPLDKSEVKSLVHRFPGAYVKEPPAKKIFTGRDGIIGDLDATSLYPSMILQYNISFETLYGTVVEPKVAGIFDFLKTYLGGPKYPLELYPHVFDLSRKYAQSRNVQNRSELEAKIYTVIVHALQKLKQSGLTLDELMNPKSDHARHLLKTYLLNLLILLTEVHDPEREVNSFAYEWLVNGEAGEGELYVVENINDRTNITRQQRNSFLSYLKEKRLILTLSGALFHTHEERPGMFGEFLLTMRRLRQDFKAKRDQNPPDSDSYRFYDHRQTAVKIIANSLYGLLGQRGFRFSNSLLARAVTVSGRHTLKIAQQIAENILTKGE